MADGAKTSLGKTLPYGCQQIDAADVRMVAEVLREPLITQGPRVLEFEERLAEAVGARPVRQPVQREPGAGQSHQHGCHMSSRSGPSTDPGNPVLQREIRLRHTAGLQLSHERFGPQSESVHLQGQPA